MNTFFGPWTTGMAGRSPAELNSHWKQRLHMLSTLPQSPAFARRATLVVIGILAVSLWALPMLRADGPDGGQSVAGENAAHTAPELSVEQMRLLEQALERQLADVKRRIAEAAQPADEAGGESAAQVDGGAPADEVSSGSTDQWVDPAHVHLATTYLNQGNLGTVHGFNLAGGQQCTQCHTQQTVNWHGQLATPRYHTGALSGLYLDPAQQRLSNILLHNISGLYLQTEQAEPEVTLSRKTYKLPAARAAALAEALPELTGAGVLETTHDGDSLTVTTTPAAQQAVTRLIDALREESER